MKMKRRIISSVTALFLLVGVLSGCGGNEIPASSSSTPTPSQTATPDASKNESENESETNDGGGIDAGNANTSNTTPLVIPTSALSMKFSPFFSDSAYDSSIADMTQVGLLTTDRTGAIIFNGIEGETHQYNGVDYEYKGIADLAINYDESADQTTYLWTIRDDIKFSDGTPVTADDIIFTYYVYSDPTYDGSSTLYSVPILGMNEYRTQANDAAFEKYSKIFDNILEAGSSNTDFSQWTQEQQAELMGQFDWDRATKEIVDYSTTNYVDAYAERFTGFTAAEVNAEEGLQIALAFVTWGFGTIDLGTPAVEADPEADPPVEAAEAVEGTFVLTTSVTESTFNLKNGEYPTLADFRDEMSASYEGNVREFWASESIGGEDEINSIKSAFIREWAPQDTELGGETFTHIEGIKKLSPTQVEITVEGFDAVAVYQLGITVTPLHYYGDVSKYDYENNKFGFDYGDLSSVRDKTRAPMGAGPYKFDRYENKIAYFEANEYYYDGEPVTKYLQYKETDESDKISGVYTGTLDIADPSYSQPNVEEISSYNSNGEVSGDTIYTKTVDYRGYGYIGINASTVNIGGDPGSEASKNFRSGFATIFAAYRDLTTDTYYGEWASVINYPISNTSWAAPQKTDQGYRVAFSQNPNGEDIYTSDMSSDDKFAAALQASIEFFKAAGCTFDEATGKFVSVPDGAKMEYEFFIPAQGTSDHPNFILLTRAKEALDSIGFNIVIYNPANTAELWAKFDANTQEMWCAAWQATIDPDMYQIYHSTNRHGLGGTDSNHYNIADSELDALILNARTSDDQSFRKATYKACFDIVLDWAVEIPVYQRQNCYIFSVDRINLDTLTPDITTNWSYLREIEKLELR